MHTQHARSFLALILALALGRSSFAADGDWPQWRGPQRDGICRETGLLKEWPKSGPKLLWDAKKVNGGKCVGTGIASLSIVDGKLYTMGDLADPNSKVDKDAKGKKSAPKGDEFVFCLDAETGKEIWKTRIAPYFHNGNGAGARCTPTVDGAHLYALSPQGVLVCLKTQDGTPVWQKDLKEFGGRMMSGWGFSESPLVDGNTLVCTPGGKAAGMVALDKNTGSVLWKCTLPTNCGAGYSSVVVAEVAGVKQYLTVMGKELGLVGVEAATGKFLWNYARAANGTANIPTAVVTGDQVFTSTGYSSGAALLKMLPDGKQGVKIAESWFLTGKQLQNHHGGVVMIGDYIYGGHGNNNGMPFCLEWKTGKFAWGPDRWQPGTGSSTVLYADGHLYYRFQNGAVALVEATPKKFNLKSSFTAHIASNDWAHLVIWQGKLYVRGDDQLLCYDIKAK